MAGTRAGGLKASATSKARYGKDFYANIGAKGGKAGHTGGFAYKNYGAKFGAMGGVVSRRGRVINKGDELRGDEIQKICSIGGLIISDLLKKGRISEAEMNHALGTLFAMTDTYWEHVFIERIGMVLETSVIWYDYLAEELEKYQGLAREGKLDDDLTAEYRTLRNVCSAYRAATGRRVTVTKAKNKTL